MASRNKSQKSQESVYSWVASRDGEFGAAITHLNLDKTLSGNTPLTFLYPDADYRAEIVNMAYNEPDRANAAIESLIIPGGALSSSRAFARDAGDPIGSQLGVEYKVKNARNGRVTLTGEDSANSFELATVDRFNDAGPNQAIWEIVRGRPPLTGKAFTRRPKSRRAEKRGGGAAGGVKRQQMAVQTEKAFEACLVAGTHLRTNPYLERVISLMNYLKIEDPATLLKILPVLDYDPMVTFYLVVEPYKTQGEYLIPDGVLDAWGGGSVYKNAKQEYINLFSAAAGLGDDSLVFGDRASIVAAVDAVRARLMELTPARCPQSVQDAYAVLGKQNEIQDLKRVLPDSTKAALAGGKKLWQDEFRFITHVAIHDARKLVGAAERARAFRKITEELRNSWPGNNYSSELLLTNVDDLKKKVNIRTELILLTKFINSSDFLYVPMEPTLARAASGCMHDMLDETFYNRNAEALVVLERTSMVQADGISPRSIQELRMYMADNDGALPDSLMKLLKM
jgi:hypothetical protein